MFVQRRRAARVGGLEQADQSPQALRIGAKGPPGVQLGGLAAPKPGRLEPACRTRCRLGVEAAQALQPQCQKRGLRKGEEAGRRQAHRRNRLAGDF
ncbi:hypothetical protein SDC9_59241 [bioreactor metagenome]|uniref:Uncharacterized protein n=1 Tax=bioreactor metagenome TaxID=1076179 RepID=A0A644X9L7_9ZZZZ